MNAVWIDVPETFLEERRRLDQDKKDELWEGVLHMVPPPSLKHNRRAIDIYKAIERVGARRGLVAYPDPTCIYAPDVDPVSWRVPDASLARPEQESERGLESAVLAVEVLSPNDESYAKLPFYARVELSEVWIIDPKTREPKIFTIANGAFAVVPPIGGVHHSPLLDVALEVIDGPLLRLRDGDHVTDI